MAVSDFVFPSFFNSYGSVNNKPFNKLNTLTSSFSILAGGYAIIRNKGMGSEQQVFGKEMPEWRKETKTKSFSRMNRRIKKVNQKDHKF